MYSEPRSSDVLPLRLLGASLLAVGLLFGTYLGAHGREHSASSWALGDSPEALAADRALMGAPLPGDLYLVNFADLVPDPPPGGMFLLMRLESVDAQGFRFLLSDRRYRRPEGPLGDLESGLAAQDGYFNGRTFKRDAKGLDRLREARTILAVRRPQPNADGAEGRGGATDEPG